MTQLLSRAGLFCALLAGLVTLSGCDASSVGDLTSSGLYPAASAAQTDSGVEPRLINGNIAGNGDLVCKTPAVVAPNDGWWGFKVEHPVIGTATYGQFTITITEDGRTLAWEASGPNELRHVVIKGGRDTYVYDYDGSVSEDGGLLSPLNGGGNIPAISHFTICYEEL